MATDATATSAFLALEVIGTAAFAMSGVMAAAKASMDWLGAMVLALVVAIGGGTIRDTLIGRLPVAWLVDTWPVWVALATAVVMLLLLRSRPALPIEDTRSYLIADAIGLASFVILGTQIGLQADLNPFMAVAVGTITGVGGGVIRDVLTGRKPIVLVGQIYALAGIIGGLLFAGLSTWGVDGQLAVWASVAVIISIRMVAIQRQWRLPQAAPESH
jgi:uncharacterized membrane protein YeiH